MLRWAYIANAPSDSPFLLPINTTYASSGLGTVFNDIVELSLLQNTIMTITIEAIDRVRHESPHVLSISP